MTTGEAGSRRQVVAQGRRRQRQPLAPRPVAGRVEAAQVSRRWDVRTDHKLETAREWFASGGNVLVHGSDEAMVSAALDVVAACHRGRTLCCRLQPHDHDRRYGAVGRLLASVPPADLQGVPAARQRVLVAVMAGQAEALHPAAVRMAVLHLLRDLARQEPLLLVIDGLEHVDPDSAAVLTYLAERVDDLPVQVAATESGPHAALPRQRRLCPSPLLLVGVPAV
jgi:hypothetical protein